MIDRERHARGRQGDAARVTASGRRERCGEDQQSPRPALTAFLTATPTATVTLTLTPTATPTPTPTPTLTTTQPRPRP